MVSGENNPKDFFSAGVNQYKSEHYLSDYRSYMSVRQTRYLKEIDHLDIKSKVGRCALDAGCGPGFLTHEIFQKGFNMSAFDISEKMIDAARELFSSDSEGNEIIFKIGNIEKIPFQDDQFELCVSAGVIEYLNTDDIALSELNRVLKQGGYLIISVTNKYSPVGILDGLLDFIKSNRFLLTISNFILKLLGNNPVLPRTFKIRKHSPQTFIKNLERSGFEIQSKKYFYMLPWPHPIDRLFPRATHFLGSKIEFLSNSPLSFLSEGFLVVARKGSQKHDINA